MVPSIREPGAYFRANVDGTFTVLEAARKQEVARFVYVASSSCYGIPAIYPTPETAAISPQYPYALTKYLGEQLVLHWACVYRLSAVSVRLFNVYGPRARTSGTYGAVFGVFLAQLLAGVSLTIVGDGRQRRDFTFVSDVIDALLVVAASNSVGEAFNIGSGAPVSVAELVAQLGSPPTVHIPKRPGEPDCTWADISKISAVLAGPERLVLLTGSRSCATMSNTGEALRCGLPSSSHTKRPTGSDYSARSDPFARRNRLGVRWVFPATAYEIFSEPSVIIKLCIPANRLNGDRGNRPGICRVERRGIGEYSSCGPRAWGVGWTL